MEPRLIETPVRSGGEAQTSPPRQPEQKRRFQIIKLEERIAPGQIGNDSLVSGGHNHCTKPCRYCTSGGASIV
jgi:hypothetical protein